MFKGMGGLGNLTSMIGSFQHLPEKMKELNERMKSETVSASSGCGQVKITMSGTGHVEDVSIGGDLSGTGLANRDPRSNQRSRRGGQTVVCRIGQPNGQRDGFESARAWKA